MINIKKYILFWTSIVILTLCFCAPCTYAQTSQVGLSQTTPSSSIVTITKIPKTAINNNTGKPTTAQTATTHKPKRKSNSSAYTKWKRQLPFWPRKAFLLAELSAYIAIGVILAQVLEVLGIVRYLAILTWPLTKLGKIEKEASPAFIMAFQSGAIANSMLVSSRSDGSLDARQLYTSIFVVSCLSLFAHLPSFVVPIGSVLGAEATAALFAVRFAAIALEIAIVLFVSRFFVLPWLSKNQNETGQGVTAEQLEAAKKLRNVRKRD